MTREHKSFSETTLRCTEVRSKYIPLPNGQTRTVYTAHFVYGSHKLKVMTPEPLTVGKKYRNTVQEAE